MNRPIGQIAGHSSTQLLPFRMTPRDQDQEMLQRQR
jgi:hypothetical protein